MLLQKSSFFIWLLRHDVSHGSVATHLMCGDIIIDGINTNFLLILTVNYLVNRLIFEKVGAFKKFVPNFLGYPVYIFKIAIY